MVDKLKFLVVVGVVILDLAIVGVIENQRTINATVTSVEGVVVRFEDTEGNVWKYYTTTDYTIGESVNLTFDMNGTDTINDDKIINVRR